MRGGGEGGIIRWVLKKFDLFIETTMLLMSMVKGVCLVQETSTIEIYSYFKRGSVFRIFCEEILVASLDPPQLYGGRRSSRK